LVVLAFVSLMKPKPTYELKIWILRSDLKRARKVMPSAEVALDD